MEDKPLFTSGGMLLASRLAHRLIEIEPMPEGAKQVFALSPHEVAVVFDREGQTLLWHDTQASMGAIPDSRDLWTFLWEHREEVGGVAHTHPWNGPAGPSNTDTTTWRALEKGLGRLLLWPVVTFNDVRYYVFNPATEGYIQVVPSPEEGHFEGLAELRHRSGA